MKWEVDKENMSEKDILIDLEEPLRRLKCAVNAIELMTLGMKCEEDSYADGFLAIWNYLREAEEDIQKAVRSSRK